MRLIDCFPDMEKNGTAYTMGPTVTASNPALYIDSNRLMQVPCRVYGQPAADKVAFENRVITCSELFSDGWIECPKPAESVQEKSNGATTNTEASGAAAKPAE